MLRPHPLTATLFRTIRFVRRNLHRLPLDAACLAPEEPVAHQIRRFINRRRWRHLPVILVPAVKLLARSAWLIWCPIATTRLARGHGVPLFGATWQRGVIDGWLYGRRPGTTLLPLPLAGTTVMQVGHLDDYHWTLLWSVLGDHTDQLLARDKLQLSDRLAALGVPVPTLLCQLEQGTEVDVTALPWSHSSILFIKPRHGSRAIGAKSVERLKHPLYRINGRQFIRSDSLAIHLTRLTNRDALLVQTFLRPKVETLDLSPETPIELRLTTARRPGEASIVIACLMKVQQPGHHASTTLSGALAAPADPDSGVIHSGTFLHLPYRKYDAVPWNGASLEGRSIPGYDQAVSMVIKASEALPGLPVIGWDVLLTDAGPMVLEANTSISWWLIHLWHALTNTPSPLLPIIMEWIETRASEK